MESEYGLEMLQAVFAAVAPGSLWPIDMLLRVLFSSIDEVRANCCVKTVLYLGGGSVQVHSYRKF